jgi:hypothetical protein
MSLDGGSYRVHTGRPFQWLVFGIALMLSGAGAGAVDEARRRLARPSEPPRAP